MPVALLMARLGLAAIFAISGAGKLVDLRGSRQAISDFGLPEAAVAPLGLLLPLAELLVAIGLILSSSAWVASLAAIVLLLTFVVAIAVNLARGKRVDCHCFGALGSEPIGPGILLRDALFLAAAVFVAGEAYHSAGLSATNWVDSLSPIDLVFLAVLLGLSVLLASVAYLALQLLRQNGRILLRLDALEHGVPGAPSNGNSARQAVGLAVGSPAPDFSLPDLAGQTTTLAALTGSGLPVLLLFVSPDCGPCEALLPEIGAWQQEHRDLLTVALVSTGSVEANRAKAAVHGLPTVLLQRKYEVAEAYKFLGTPSAVIAGATGLIATSLVAGVPAIRTLLASVVAESVASNGRHEALLAGGSGAPAPAFDLPDLEGRPVRLVDYCGQPVLLLFWNTGCGFCQRMAPDLRAWETRRPPGTPNIIILSSGPREAMAALGFSSTVVYDRDSTVAAAYGAGGTPMAVLIDAAGRVASGVAAGAEEVFTLAGRPVPVRDTLMPQPEAQPSFLS